MPASFPNQGPAGNSNKKTRHLPKWKKPGSSIERFSELETDGHAQDAVCAGLAFIAAIEPGAERRIAGIIHADVASCPERRDHGNRAVCNGKSITNLEFDLKRCWLSASRVVCRKREVAGIDIGPVRGPEAERPADIQLLHGACHRVKSDAYIKSRSVTVFRVRPVVEFVVKHAESAEDADLVAQFPLVLHEKHRRLRIKEPRKRREPRIDGILRRRSRLGRGGPDERSNGHAHQQAEQNNAHLLHVLSSFSPRHSGLPFVSGGK